jgi:hypothetical protein
LTEWIAAAPCCSFQIVLAATMLVLATLIAMSTVRIRHIMVLAAITGTASRFDWPARLSLGPSHADQLQLQSTSALNAAIVEGPDAGRRRLPGTGAVGLCDLLGLTPLGGSKVGFLASHVGVQTALAVRSALVLCWVPVLLQCTPVARLP